MNNVESKFIDRAIIKGGIRWYAKADAIELVRECEKLGITILGIDAAYVTEKYTQPSMENSIDYSSASMSKLKGNIYQEAIFFLENRADEFYFEIVIGG